MDKLLLIIIFIVVFAVFTAWTTAAITKRDAFMRECVQDHKRYECEIMYK